MMSQSGRAHYSDISRIGSTRPGNPVGCSPTTTAPIASLNSAAWGSETTVMRLNSRLRARLMACSRRALPIPCRKCPGSTKRDPSSTSSADWGARGVEAHDRSLALGDVPVLLDQLFPGDSQLIAKDGHHLLQVAPTRLRPEGEGGHRLSILRCRGPNHQAFFRSLAPRALALLPDATHLLHLLDEVLREVNLATGIPHVDVDLANLPGCLQGLRLEGLHRATQRHHE